MGQSAVRTLMTGDRPDSQITAAPGSAPAWGTPSSRRMRERVSVISLVLLLHVGLGLLWMMQPEQPAVVVSEMTVSVAVPQAEVSPPKVQPAPPTPPKPKPTVERTEKPAPKPPVAEHASVAAPLPVAEPEAPAPAVAAPVAPVAPVVPAAAAPAPVVVTEPDYKAAYLNNPRPPYPMVARRMGWSGKVILNVEVLAEGSCGELSVFKSSGHDILDKAAMQTVKSWRFTPARRGGQPVTQWFKVPIQFSLEES